MQYTIQTATFSKEKQVSGNPMHIYVLDLIDGNGQVIRAEVLQRPTSPQPQPGTTVEGEIQPSSNPQYLPTFKRAQQAGGGGKGGGGGGYGPEDIARITRSHAQQMALRFLTATGGLPIDWNLENGGDEDQRDAEITAGVGMVKRLANWFQADVDRAAKAVAGQQTTPPAGQPPAQQAPPAQPPAQQTPPAQQPPAQAPAQADPDDDIPF